MLETLGDKEKLNLDQETLNMVLDIRSELAVRHILAGMAHLRFHLDRKMKELDLSQQPKKSISSKKGSDGHLVDQERRNQQNNLQAESGPTRSLTVPIKLNNKTVFLQKRKKS